MKPAVSVNHSWIYPTLEEEHWRSPVCSLKNKGGYNFYTKKERLVK